MGASNDAGELRAENLVETPNELTKRELGRAKSAVAMPEKFDAGLYYVGRIHTPWKTREGMPAQQPRVRRGLHHRASIRATPTRSRMSKPRPTSSFSTGWIRRAAISCCRRRAITTPSAAHLHCARRCDPIPIAASVVETSEGRRHQAQRHRPRLHRRHAAGRHQAIFRLDRRQFPTPASGGMQTRRNSRAMNFTADAVECS